jgi:hypothetical protein
VSDGTTNEFGTGEIPAQIRLVRVRPSAQGYLLYNTTTTLKSNGGAVAQSVKPLHAIRAIPPVFSWLDAVPPPPPIITVDGEVITIIPGEGEAARWWHVRVRIARAWTTFVLFGTQSVLPLDDDPERVIVHAIDMAGNASAPYIWLSTPP